MKLAVNYSDATADLIRAGQISSDRVKCPAWPDLIPTAQGVLPTYVHFPLRVGLGIGDAIDTETNQPADWGKVERLLTQTDTPFVNVHLSLKTTDFPHIPADTRAQAHIEMLVEHLTRDVQAVVDRFGAGRVIVENVHDSWGANLRPAFLAQVIRQVVEETQCGFLLDVAHAHLAATHLGVRTREYINALPVAKIREMHVSGVQFVKGPWLELFRSFDHSIAERFAGRQLDHLPMTDEDWALIEWSIQQVRDGRWGKPWAIAFECGGVSPLWELITDSDVLERQVPRLYNLIHEKPREEKTQWEIQKSSS